ncbi:hypothetical protein BIT28_25105 [Photobacterium proteolyticum]|uniref:DUF2955 domain-containing protein n=1 Tax=Photobacterium proteolyticum TaxID=1903952 RepID=A0A1Q9H7P5_9GAMM|nr:DUF2955 domain-containing protein [Photobacterium proteolyticum]OLQ83766.1 hypothetical protein BIT28_25105 [Photobacterium proteolyticum]
MYEVFRKTLIISICLVLSKALHLNVGVFMVIYSIVIATTCYSKHIWVMMQRLLPTLLTAFGAILINQLFSSHPFIIWTLSVIYFDHIRKLVDNSIKAKRAIMPLFIIIFINTYSISAELHMRVPEFFRDMVFSMLCVCMVASFVNHVMPIKARPAIPVITPLPVTGADRLKMLILVGGGLAFLMTNEVTSATFVLVPVLTSILQPSHRLMKKQARNRLLTQVGGCCTAMVCSMVYAGTQVNLLTFSLLSFSLVFLLLRWCNHPDPEKRNIHADAMMGILVPYQLYIGKYGNDFGFVDITLRAFELLVALLIVYLIADKLEKKDLGNNNEENRKVIALLRKSD